MNGDESPDVRRVWQPDVRRAEDRGQAGVLVIGLFLVGLSFLGLAVDVARAFAARASLQSQADGAALAATSAVDDAALARGEVVLRPGDADARARSLLARAALDPEVEVVVTAGAGVVEVTLRRRVGTVFLRLVGVDAFDITASGTAAPRVARP